MLLAAAGLSAGGAVATAGSASAVSQCPASTVLLRNLCISIGSPTPATTPPATTPPLISLPPVTLPPVTLPPVLTPGPGAAVTDAAQRLLDLANTDRQAAGLPALASRDDIVAIALAHSQEMAQAGDIFHSTTFLTSSVKQLLNAGIGGENVAYNGDIDNAHVRLMASPGHRANLMDGRFTTVGFAVVRAADGRYFITEDFIQAAGAPRAAAAPRPAAPAASRQATAPRTAPAPAPAPATTIAPPPPTTAAPVVTAPPVAATSTLPTVRLHAASSAIAATPADSAHDATELPLAGTAAVLLVGALCACCIVPRHFER